MKTRFNKFTAFIATIAVALSCVFSTCVNVSATNDRAKADSYDLTIGSHDNCTTDHQYVAYQIFTGVVSDAEGDEGLLTNIKWSEDISETNRQAILDLYDATDLDDFVTKLRAITDTTSKEQLADNLVPYLSNPRAFSAKSNGVYKLVGVEPGYYLIMDKAGSLSEKPDAYTEYILKVTRNQTITPKSTYPTVDKEVSDEKDEYATQAADSRAYAPDGSNVSTWETYNEWKETADHDINEQFQFRLTANIPIAAHTTSEPRYDPFGDYDHYTITFNDKLSDGVTFENIQRVYVEIGDGTGAIETITLNESDFTTTARGVQGTAGAEWTLTVNDLKIINGSAYNYTGKTTLKVYVVYNAHLNSNAIVENSSTTGKVTNNNRVYLNYSNNPNITSEYGKTETDIVWVFAYKLHYFKKDGTTDAPLKGVGFTLYTDDMDGGKKEVPVIYDETIGAYRPTQSSETGVEMRTNESDVEGKTGTIDIVGLDAGRYYLRETHALPGYEAYDNDLTILITANHNELASGAQASLELTGQNRDFTITNTKANAIPQTGGIGNYVFYGAGIVMILCGVSYFVLRRKSE